MKSEDVRGEIARELDRLSPVLRRRVLGFARALSSGRPRGTPGKAMARFAHWVSPATAKAWDRAIREGCEQVDPDGW